jgi:mitochondrial FAD-linked sulfhydryl oxidase
MAPAPAGAWPRRAVLIIFVSLGFLSLLACCSSFGSVETDVEGGLSGPLRADGKRGSGSSLAAFAGASGSAAATEEGGEDDPQKAAIRAELGAATWTLLHRLAAA